MKVVYCTLFPLVSFYLKFSHIRFLMRQYVQIHLAYAMYSFLHRTIFSHWIFWVEFLMRHAFRGIRPRGSVMKRVLVGLERASTETWAPSRTLTPQVHIYIYERRGKSFVQIYYLENNEKRAPPYICVLSTFVFVWLFFLVGNTTLLGIISFTTGKSLSDPVSLC